MRKEAEKETLAPPPSGTKESSFAPAGKETLSTAPQGAEERNRFWLTYLSLCLVLVSIVGIMILLPAMKFDASGEIEKVLLNHKNQGFSPASDSLLSRKIELINHIREEKKDYREFFLKQSNMILLNLLLPILTAILAYKVGVRKSEE